jgi:hypothetical protein
VRGISQGSVFDNCDVNGAVNAEYFVSLLRDRTIAFYSNKKQQHEFTKRSIFTSHFCVQMEGSFSLPCLLRHNLG